MNQSEKCSASTTSERDTISRRMRFAALPVMVILVYKTAFARPNLGDKEWMQRFRELVKTFNTFLEVLNEGKFDVAKWNAVRAAWKGVDVA